MNASDKRKASMMSFPLHSMLKAGEEMSIDDPRQYLLKDIGIKRALLNWIHNGMEARSLRRCTSYALKHLFENATGVYVTNGVFKGAMLAAGFEPKDSSEQNWRFKYKALSTE